MHPTKRHIPQIVVAIFWAWALFLSSRALGVGPLPDGPGPVTNRVALLTARRALTWMGWGTNLLVNGDFETGDLTGWREDGPFGRRIRILSPPAGADTAPNIFAGRHSVGFLSGMAGPLTLSQVVSLPADATGAVLSWVDLIRNNATRFTPPDHAFRVEVQTPDGFPLAVVFETVPGDPLRTAPWSRRSVSLGAFAGQTIRIAFITSISLQPLNVTLDDIRLETAAPLNTTFEVFLSSGAAPTEADRIGSTEVPSIPMPVLQPDTQYHWRVRTHHSQEILDGPVWSFRTGTNGPASRFHWELASEEFQVFQNVIAGLEARDSAGFPAPAFTNLTQVAIVSRSGRPVSMMISEILPNTGVEFLNATSEPVELTGWEVSLYDSSTWPKPRTTFVFPAGARAAAGTNFSLMHRGRAPGSGGAFFTGQPINWILHPAHRVIAVLLRNPSGEIVDFFAADQAFPEAITEPVPVPLSEWIGRPAPRVASQTESYQRLGSRDRQMATDWLVGHDSFGWLNTYGGPFFLPGLSVHGSGTIASNAFSNGSWTGTVEPVMDGSDLLFLADDRQGTFGFSRPVNVSPAPSIILTLPESLNEGGTGTATLQLPSALQTNLVVQLESSWPERLPLPAAVTIPAGVTQVSVPLTVPEDDRLHGLQNVTISLRAPAFSLTQGTLSITDSETTELGLELPVQLVEGGAEGIGILTVAQAPVAPVRVELSVTVVGQLVLPTSVLIPAGQNQVAFPVRAVNDLFIDGDVTVGVIARSGNWTEASVSVVAVDNEDRQLRLVVPGRIRGNAPVQGQVQLSGLLTSDLVVLLDSVESGILATPDEVRIPAGSTNAVFEIEAVPGESHRGSSLVALTASSPDFLSTTRWSEVWHETVRTLTLAVSDLLLHPGWDRLLLLVAARDAAHPNELVVLNPYTGEIERTLSVAADPGSMALTDDGRFLWVGSQGEGLVQKVDLDAFSVTSSFSMEGPLPIQLIARPGRSDSVMVYRYLWISGVNEVALYTDGVQQPDVYRPGHMKHMSVTRGDGDRLFASVPSDTHGVHPSMLEFKVTDAGLSLERIGPEDFAATWIWSEGRLYSGLGRVRDAATFKALPSIAGLPFSQSLLTVEPQRDQAFFLTWSSGWANLTRANLSLNTIAESIAFPLVKHELGMTRPVRWGDQGLAFRVDDTLYLIESAYIDPGPSADVQITGSVPATIRVNQEFDWTLTVTNAGPAAATGIRLTGALPAGLMFVHVGVPGGTGAGVWGGWNATVPPLPPGTATTVRVRLRPTLAGSPPLSVLAALFQRDPQPSNNSVTAAPFVQLDLGLDARQEIDLAAADLCYDPVRDVLWATVPDELPEGRNDRLVRINLDTGLITASFPSGRLPGRLIRSDDGAALFVALDGESLIQRFDLATETWGARLELFDHPTNDFPAKHVVTDLVVLPGSPERVAAVWSLPTTGFNAPPVFRTVAFRDGMRLPDELQSGPEIERGSAPDEVVTFTGGYPPGYSFGRHSFGETGLTAIDSREGVLGGLDIRVVGNRVYSNSGQVMELPGLTPIRDFGFLPLGPVLPLPALNRLVFINNGAFATQALLSMKVVDEQTGRLIREIRFGAEHPAMRPLVHCGGDRLALRARSDSATANRIVILRTTAIPSATTPADIQTRLVLTTPVVSSPQEAEFRLTVTNAGPGVAERVHYSLTWGGEGILDRLAPGESEELVFRIKMGGTGRFPVQAAVFSAAPDPVPSNDSVSHFQSVSQAPLPGHQVSLMQENAGFVSDPEGRRLFVAAPDGVVQVDPATGTLEPSSRFGPNPGALAVSADGSSLWVAHDQERTLSRFRLSDGALLHRVTGLPGNAGVWRLIAHPTDSAMAAFVLGPQVFVVTAEGVEELYSTPNTQSIWALAFGPDGTLFLSRTKADGSQPLHPLERIGTAGAQRGQVLASGLNPPATHSIRIHAGRVYLDHGVMFDAETLENIPIVAERPPGSPAIIAPASWVAYFQRSRSPHIRLLSAHDLSLVGTAVAGGSIGLSVDESSMVHWGADGLVYGSNLGLTLIRLGRIPVPADRDFDGDGLTDDWEWDNNFNPNIAADGLSDPDGDGVITRDEVIAGTDFLQRDSVLSLRNLSMSEGILKVRFDGVSGRRYQLEGASPLGAEWQSVGEAVLGQDAPVDLEITTPAGLDTGAYRLRVTRN